MLEFRFCHKEYDFYAGIERGVMLYNIVPSSSSERKPMTGGYESFGYIASRKKLSNRDWELVSDWMKQELKAKEA